MTAGAARGAALRATICRVATPTTVHYASLAVGLLSLLWIGRDQWFFGDDWVSLARHQDSNLMGEQGGHWKLATSITFQLLRNWLGLGSYFPYLLVALLAHLAVAHLIWRVLRRVGAHPWIATILAVVVIYLGAGSENILWAFQFGFMGAVASGLAVLLLFDRQRLNVPLLVILSVLAPTFAGTALPLLAAAAIVGWVRHGFVRTLLILLPAAIVYVAWYLNFSLGKPGSPTGAHSVAEFGFAFVYAAAMYGGGLGRALPWIGLGVLPSIAVAVWFFRSVRSGISTTAAPAYALVIGSVFFVALTSWSRVSFGLTSAATGRYAYVTIVMLLPAIGIVLTSLAARGSRGRALTNAVLGVVLATNVIFLAIDARDQAIREQGSRARVLASLSAIVETPTDPNLLAAPADPQWAPDLLGSDLLWFFQHKQIGSGD